MNFTPLVLSLACAAPLDTSTSDPVFAQAKAAPGPVLGVPTPGPNFAAWPRPGKPGPPQPERDPEIAPVPPARSFDVPVPEPLTDYLGPDKFQEPQPNAGFRAHPLPPKFSEPFTTPRPAVEQPHHQLEQVFQLEADEALWSNTLRVQRVPGKLKSVEVEVVVHNDWYLRSESLSPGYKPLTTDVELRGYSRVWAFGQEFGVAGVIQHELRTRFDGVWDFKGPSGQTSMLSASSEPFVISLAPSDFQGEGYVGVGIEGLQLVHTHVSGSSEVAFDPKSRAQVSLRFRFIRE